jgi:hypothetical protein
VIEEYGDSTVVCSLDSKGCKFHTLSRFVRVHSIPPALTFVPLPLTTGHEDDEDDKTAEMTVNKNKENTDYLAWEMRKKCRKWKMTTLGAFGSVCNDKIG